MTNIALVTMGGTIEAVTSSATEGVAPTGDESILGAAVKTALAGLEDQVSLSMSRLVARSSAALSFADILSLHARLLELFQEGADALLVTTGTDTMEELAFALDLLWAEDAPLVVTGAMRHLGQPGSDAVSNLRAGILVAASPNARGQGCLVVMNGEIHYSWQVRKAHASSAAAFCSMVSGPAGSVSEDVVRMIQRPISRPLLARPKRIPEVALVKASLGDDGRVLELLPGLGFKGLVMECLGGGSVPPSWVPQLKKLVDVMPVVYTSRTGSGPALTATYGGQGSEMNLREMGILSAGLLDGVHTRVLLSLLIAAGSSDEQVSTALSLFDTPEPGGLPYRIPSTISGEDGGRDV